MSYLLDANVFISAKNLHYGFDFCPAFWDWLDRMNEAGNVFSVEKVYFEIEGREDQLSAWLEPRQDRLFLGADADTTESFGRVTTWVYGRDYTQAAKDEFLDVADFYLVSQALQGSHTVVTHERPRNSKSVIKIPDVCYGLGIKVMNPFDMLRLERARFVLEVNA